uniref:Acyl-ACP thioesterase-like C-terminal domain-containing protein n=1 Tax=Salix viminalis TaxID=40686 RepID=A0A6N2KU70_SALVM
MLENLNGFCRGEVGENGMRRDWLIRSDATGEVLVPATRVLQMLNTTCVMMNQQTRGLSKMPEAKTFQEEIPENINKLSTNAIFTKSNSMPKRSDLDMNHHVNNVRYKRMQQFRHGSITSDAEEGGVLKKTSRHCNHTKSLKTYTHLLQITGYKESDEIARDELCGKESSKLCNWYLVSSSKALSYMS